MRRIALVLLFLIDCAMAQPFTKEVASSPDEKIQLTFRIEDGRPTYSVNFSNKSLIGSSSLGFEFMNMQAIDSGLILYNVVRSSVDETWKPVWGTDAEIRNHYSSALFFLRETNSPNRSFYIEFRVYNDGVAFRYVFPESWTDSLFITSENTEFRFSCNDSAWWIPSNEFAYESLYRHTPLSEIAEANTPLTVVAPEYCMSIHEAQLIDYSEMYLMQDSTNPLLFRSALWPWPDGVCVRAETPFKTPWRSITITRTPGELMESHLIQNLNEPCAISDVSWIKPMKFVGVWWGMHTGRYTWYDGPKHGATTKRTKQYIDFATKHHIGGVLAEGWNQGWETWASDSVPNQDFCKAYPDFNIEKVVKYAKKHQVEFISHHETGGNIPMYESQLDSALALCSKLGIHYLKTGYAGPIRPDGMHHHGQYMVRHFQKVVETAAQYHINLDVHESIKPTGLDRTWPNLMTQEAVRGNEWNATYRATPPGHSAILPFTRMLAGPFDNTPGIVHVNYAPEKNKRLYCTATHQAAMYMVFYSPLMMMSDLPENYENSNLTDFISSIPDSWDQTIVPAADPGNYVCVARRNDDKWFVGALADENCYLLKIPLTFLQNSGVYKATIIHDNSTTDWELNPESCGFSLLFLRRSDTLFVPLSKAGGFLMKIEPAFQISPDENYSGLQLFNMIAANSMDVFEKQKTFGETHISHLAVGSKITLNTPYSPLYPASGNNALCDGVIGSYNFSNGGWQGFEGSSMEAIIELPEETSISSISANFLYSPNDWIFLPSSVDYYYSEDGISYKLLKSTDIPGKRPADVKIMEIRNIEARFESVNARYIKVVAASSGICPEWHYAKEKKSWVFVDEIIVK